MGVMGRVAQRRGGSVELGDWTIRAGLARGGHRTLRATWGDGEDRIECFIHGLALDLTPCAAAQVLTLGSHLRIRFELAGAVPVGQAVETMDRLRRELARLAELPHAPVRSGRHARPLRRPR